MKHFLQFIDFDKDELTYLFARAAYLKAIWKRGTLYQPLQGKVLTMIFEKHSTRTRVSFEAGMAQLGGHALFLSSQESQLSRGEPIEDSAKVISSMSDLVMIRTFDQSIVERFAAYSRVPVINGLSNQYHPCQVLADIFTYMEEHGSIEGKTVAWIGDSNNIAYTWLQAARILNFTLHVATPPDYAMQPTEGVDYSAHLVQFREPLQAVRHADIVTTDVFTSMGYEAEQEARVNAFTPYRVTEQLMAQASPEAIFLHCLPAHRGEEVDAAVIDGPQSRVWAEAENRLHTQKAVIEYLLLGRQ
jgi:ornithine carbamoyltransferase